VTGNYGGKSPPNFTCGPLAIIAHFEMKKSNYIILALLFFSLKGFTQTDNNMQIKTVDWFSDSVNTLNIESNENKNKEFGELKIVGWTENGLIAYIFSPKTTLLHDKEECFYIYDLINNKFVWEKFSYNVDWNNSENEIVAECIVKLYEYNFVKNTFPELNPSNVRILQIGDFTKVIDNTGEKMKVLLSVDSRYKTCEMFKTIGYFVSPFDKELSVFIFPIQCELEKVWFCGIKNM